METNLPKNQPSTLPPAPQVIPPKKSNPFLPFLLGILFTLFLGGGLFILFKDKLNTIPLVSSPEPVTNVVPTPDLTAGWQTYTSSKGYQFKYPKNLTVKINAPGFIVFQTDINIPGTIWFSVDERGVNTVEARKILKQQELINVQFNSIPVTGVDGFVVVGTGKEGMLQGISVKSAYINLNGKELIIECSNQQCQDVLDQILSTFKFLDTTSADPTAGWQTYTNTQYGFEFKYPANYSYTDEFKIQDELNFSTFYEINLKKDIYKEVAQNPAIHLIAVKTVKDIQTYLNDELKQEISSWETFKKESGLSGNETPNISKTENVIINSISFTKVARERSPNAPNNKETQYLFKKGDVLYIWYANYGSYDPDVKEDGTSEIKILDQILSTFKFLD